MENTCNTEELWDLRNEGKVSRCYEKFIEHCSTYGISSRGDIRKRFLSLCEHLSKTEAIEFLLLEPSFHRNYLRFEESEKLVTEIEEIAHSAGVGNVFQLSFQKGLNAFAKSDFSTSFDCFLSAKRLSASVKEQLSVLFNIILVMENLYLDYGTQFKELKLLLEHLNDDTLVSFYRSKVAGLEARESFRSGNFDVIHSLEKQGESEDHLSYFLAYLGDLPHYQIIESTDLKNRFSNQYCAEAARWINGYRLRTLQGLLIASDLGPHVFLREKIERYYLWVWRWLTNPSSELLDKLQILRKDISTANTVTPQEFFMLENAQRWLGFFANESDEDARSNVSRLSSTQGKLVLTLEYERYLLDYLYARRNSSTVIASDTRSLLRQHPCHEKVGFSLPSLIDSIEGAALQYLPFKELENSLLRFFPKKRQSISNGILVNALDSSIQKILSSKIKGTVDSQAITSLFFLLIEKQIITKPELLEACYGIRRYDPFIHNPKIANLVSQVNRLYRPLVFLKTRGENVVVSKIERDLIHFSFYCQHSAQLRQLPSSRSFFASGATSSEEGSTYTSIIENFCNEWKSREEYEQLLSISKATATRRIKRWIERDLITKRGKGKTSFYKMHSPLKEKLLKQLEVQCAY